MNSNLQTVRTCLWLILALFSLSEVISSAARCPFPQHIDNAVMTVTGDKVYDTVTFSCLDGFWYNGLNPRVCKPDGLWSGHTGYCEGVTLKCPNPGSVEKGHAVVKGENINDTLSYSCYEGYWYNGTTPRICKSDGTWSGPDGYCEEVARNRCKELKPQKHLVIDYEKFAHKHAVYIYCKDGFIYNGSNTIICEKDGSWSGDYGSCNENKAQPATFQVSYIIGIVIPAATIIIIAISTVICRNQRSVSTRAKKLYRHSFQHLDRANKSIVLESLIDPATISLRRLIGKGQYGEVHEGSMKRSGERNVQSVALKTLKGYNQKSVELNQFISEATIMKGFSHPNILPFTGITFIVTRLYVVFPFMKNGVLKSFIQKNPFNLVKAIQFLYDIVKGMNYLASQKFVHGNLAARNCMVDDSEHVVIGDFGLSRDIYHTEYYSPTPSDKPLPVKWMALESLETGLFTTMSDIWSFGVLAWEIFTSGCIPYPHLSGRELKSFLLGGGRLNQPESCPPVIFSAMTKCWETRPGDRPSFGGLVTAIGYFLHHPDELKSASPYPTPMPSSASAINESIYANRSYVDHSDDEATVLELVGTDSAAAVKPENVSVFSATAKREDVGKYAVTTFLPKQNVVKVVVHPPPIPPHRKPDDRTKKEEESRPRQLLKRGRPDLMLPTIKPRLHLSALSKRE